jgi:glycosyltransferase involved in cell wall biosynthesis
MKKTINITIATNTYGTGGVATVLQILHLYDFFTLTGSKLISSHCNRRKMFGFKRILYFISAFFHLLFYGLTHNLGVVHVHMSSRGSYTRKAILIRLARYLGAKTIIHLHGSEFKEFYLNECNTKKQQHIRDTFNLADRVIVLSTQWAAWISTITKDSNKINVVYNAVPDVSFTKIAQENPAILFLGRLGERKGVADLINAFSLISNQFPDCTLQLGGDGDIEKYRKQVNELNLTDRVQFLGWVSGETKNDYLSKASIYCLPSYNEGFPMGILEAMSAGVAVVASKAGGIPDAIADGEEGLLVDAGNVTQLSEALRRMLQDDAQREQFAQAAKSKFQNNFSPEVIIPQLETIYKELLEPPRG